MYCPNCSQRQISEETKFCSRCGLPLAVVAEVVANGGFLPPFPAAESSKKRRIFTRRNGLLLALFWFMFFVMILVPFSAITGAPEELTAALTLFGTMGSLFLTVLSFAVLRKEMPAKTASNQSPETIKNFYRHNQNALPPEQSIPVSAFVPPQQANWRDTKDLVQPSVTEGTTKLLSKDEQ